MKTLIVTFAFLAAACLPALAEGNKYGWSNPHNPHYSGVPGPLAGAGLPILAVGCCAYWLVRRYRRI
jgi:hypothetical protein